MVKPTDLSSVLKRFDIRASAPGRIAVGGTWDVEALAFLSEELQPCSVNFAVDLKTSVRLSPYPVNRICVCSSGFSIQESHFKALSFDNPLGLIWAVVSFFNISGVKLTVTSKIPPRSGLGGSGVLCVTVIAAISKALGLIHGQARMSNRAIALLAHGLERSLNGNLSGLQDQLAAVYGGVNKWTWRYSRPDSPFKRDVLLTNNSYSELEDRIALCYTGKSRDSITTTGKFVKSFLSGKDRSKWRGLKELTDRFAAALVNKEWMTAAVVLQREASLRRAILHETEPSICSDLRRCAAANRCGSGFAAGNENGCMFAIGEKENIRKLKEGWERYLRKSDGGFLLPCRISATGLAVHCTLHKPSKKNSA